MNSKFFINQIFKIVKKVIVIAAVLLFAAVQSVKAQTNLQIFYDMGRGHFTTTLEGYYGDGWGDTFFFIDYDFNAKTEEDKHVGVSGSYMEIARGFNFWQNTALKNLSAHVEYNGGVNFGNQNWLFGVNYLLHNADYSNTFTFELLGKTFCGNAKTNCPLQFTFVWGMQDLFGLTGLRFSGFVDVWGEETSFWYGDKNPVAHGTANVVAISEPQLWYNVGRHFGVKNLNIGTEVELSYNFAGCHGFKCRPCLGTKWVF